MFDIDKYLDNLQIKEVEAGEELLQRTKKRCEEAAKTRRRSEAMRHFKKAALIAVPAAAVLLAGIFIGARFFAPPAQTSAAYYTVDINPSICVTVGEDGLVTGVQGQNGDAQALLGSLSCEGVSAGEAIRQIIAAAQAAGYFSEGPRYVLIGCFTADGAPSQGELGGLQAMLEESFGDMIELLIVSGTLEDKQMADALRVSAGLLKLSQMAEGVEVADGDKVEDVVDEITQVNQAKYVAPDIAVSGDDQTLRLSWNALDFAAMGYTGKVKYHIVSAAAAEGVAGFDAKTLKTVSFYTYGSQTTSASLKLSECGAAPGEKRYYGIWAEYAGVMVAGKAFAYTAPAAPGATPAPSESQPEPAETPAPSGGYTVSGRVSGGNVILSWTKDTRADFAGYKIVASRTNPNPSYPGDGYLKYITNVNTTSITLCEGLYGLQGGTAYYFSVTYLYHGSDPVAGNAVRLKVPDKDEPAESEEPPAPSGGYVASPVSGYISDDGKIHLSWQEVCHSGFDGYKVMYSFTDSSPVYGESGCSYYDYITDPARTSCSFAPCDIGAKTGETVYFSITVLYDGHTVKKAGNTISLVMPETEPEPEEPYVATDISGSISGTAVSLSWGKVDHSQFEGYKVMYSFTDSSPVYGVSGDYARWITDASTTGCTLDITSLNGYSPGATCWFSISVLYNGHSVVKAGNSAPFTAP
jgi:hypothetical protein